jgi:hypothetical protein
VFDSKVMRNRKLNVPKTDIHAVAVAKMYAQRLTSRSKLKTHEINEGDEIKEIISWFMRSVCSPKVNEPVDEHKRMLASMHHLLAKPTQHQPCMRCGTLLSEGYEVSVFNTDIICRQCAADEVGAPGHTHAFAEQLQALGAMDFDYQKVGLSAVDEFFLERRRNQRL